MRTVLSEEAVAATGRTGCGEVIQERVVEGGKSEARGLMVRGRLMGLEEGMMCAGVSVTSSTENFMAGMARRDRSRVWSAEDVRDSPSQLNDSHNRKHAGGSIE